MNFVIAILIGLVIGAIGAVALRQRDPKALWLAPALAVVGAVIASILATLFGKAGYGWKEAALQVVLAVAGVAAVAVLATRRTTRST